MEARKPPRLRRGDTIGVIAPGGPVNPQALAQGVEMLERAGFRVRVGDAVLQRTRYLAGSDAARCADLLSFLHDPSVSAIFAARGGYGTGRLLPLLDRESLPTTPKPVVGHSDLTFLLNYLHQREGWVTFHGPMVAWFAESPEAPSTLLELLMGEPAGTVEGTDVLREGSAEGILVGGCLSILAAMVGTPYAVETLGRILYIEDINEPPYRLDRLLTQLAQAGTLDGIAALLIGPLPNCLEGFDVPLAEVIGSICGGARFPIVAGFPSGHGATATVPLGVRARVEGVRLEFLDAAVA